MRVKRDIILQENYINQEAKWLPKIYTLERATNHGTKVPTIPTISAVGRNPSSGLEDQRTRKS